MSAIFDFDVDLLSVVTKHTFLFVIKKEMICKRNFNRIALNVHYFYFQGAKQIKMSKIILASIAATVFGFTMDYIVSTNKLFGGNI